MASLELLVWFHALVLKVSILLANPDGFSASPCNVKVGTLTFCGAQPVHPAGVDSDSIGMILYSAVESTGAACTGLTGDAAKVTTDPVTKTNRPTRKRNFLNTQVI